MVAKSIKVVIYTAAVTLTIACTSRTQDVIQASPPSSTSTATSPASTAPSTMPAEENQRPTARPDGPPTFTDMLSKLDVNNDGKLAESEVEGPLRKDFKRIDKNGDGFITESEMKKAGPPRRRDPNG